MSVRDVLAMPFRIAALTFLLLYRIISGKPL